MKKINVGYKVYYISGKFGYSSSNPLKGSEFECQGTVIKKKNKWYRVRWDNGVVNNYKLEDLEVIVEDHLGDDLFNFNLK